MLLCYSWRLAWHLCTQQIKASCCLNWHAFAQICWFPIWFYPLASFLNWHLGISLLLVLDPLLYMPQLVLLGFRLFRKLLVHSTSRCFFQVQLACILWMSFIPVLILVLFYVFITAFRYQERSHNGKIRSRMERNHPGSEVRVEQKLGKADSESWEIVGQNALR